MEIGVKATEVLGTSVRQSICSGVCRELHHPFALNRANLNEIASLTPSGSRDTIRAWLAALIGYFRAESPPFRTVLRVPSPLFYCRRPTCEYD